MGPAQQDTREDRAAYDVVSEAQKRYAQGRDAERENDQRALDDLNMYAGRQWDPNAERERKGDRRPALTDNRFPPLIKQVTGEIRRNPFAIRLSPADGAASPAGARVLEGLIRYVERISAAPRVYSRLGQQTAQGGKGYIRLGLAWSDDDTFALDVKIQSIRNPFSVTVDPNAKEDDLSDARWMTIEQEMGADDFKEAYPDSSPSAFAMTAPRAYQSWRSGNKVKVLEYWVVKYTASTLHRVVHTRAYFDREIGQWVAPSGAEAIVRDPDEQLLAEMYEEGWDVVQSRPSPKKTVCMYLLGGNETLEGPIEQPWSRIPIFRAVGEEIDIGDEVFRHGLVYHGRDNQRILNSARSYDFELVMAAPKAPYIVHEKQIEGYENEWRAAITRHLPYLRYKDVPGVAPPKRADPVGTNPGPQALGQSAIDGIKANVGIFDASIGRASRETSGVAIEARDAQADTGTFVYIDNLAACIEAVGRELVYVLPKVYGVREQITILGEDDAAEIVELDQQTKDGIFKGKYAVAVKTGPAYQTRREKENDSLIELAASAPPPLQPLYHLELAKRRDGSEEFARRLETVMVQTGLIPPEEGAPNAPLPMQGADPLAQVSPPAFVPAGRPRVGDGQMPAAPPGMMGAA